jgi:hypothetical protein
LNDLPGLDMVKGIDPSLLELESEKEETDKLSTESPFNSYNSSTTP